MSFVKQLQRRNFQISYKLSNYMTVFRIAKFMTCTEFQASFVMSTLLLSFYLYVSVFMSLYILILQTLNLSDMYDLKTMHHHYVCNHRVTNIILYLIYRYVYYLPAYQLSHVYLQWLTSCNHQTERYRRISRGCHLAILQPTKILP